MSQQVELNIADINILPESLRDVNLTSPAFVEFSANVKQVGVLTPIRVTTMKDSVTGEDKVYLVDGLQRYTAAKNAGFETIKAVLAPNLTKMEILRDQFTLNIMKIETRPVEYSRQLNRMLREDNSLSPDKLAAMVGKSTTYIKERLGLTNLTSDIANIVDKNGMILTNACVLSKLPVEEQPAFLERAMQSTFQEFAPLVDARMRDLAKAKREGRAAAPETFVLVEKIKKDGEVKEEIAGGKAKSALLENCETAEDGWDAALAWVMGTDAISAADKMKKWEADQSEKADKAAKAAEQRDAKKSESGKLKSERMQYQFKLQSEGVELGDIARKLVDWDIEHNILPKPIEAPK
jgi:ParB/RepB/Spo0J family partition protein